MNIKYDWLEKQGISEEQFNQFKIWFPDNIDTSTVLRRYSNRKQVNFAIYLVDKLPFNRISLDLENFEDENLIYDGNVTIKGNVKLSSNNKIYIKGDLQIDGKLELTDLTCIYAKSVNVKEICMNSGSKIVADVVTKKLFMKDYSSIFGNVETNKLSMEGNENGNTIHNAVKAKKIHIDKNSRILGETMADEIFIKSNVKKLIENFKAKRIVYV